ncbi:zinc-dependent alcohol dehydrogenase family protein [Streptomyces sp. Inha503]|uniref:zinc-dependent alcohol dehydrogenase family protein n=1 Tax=Streptomyces sp. Inha503 TaxID=3383314 RepID=UPI0039A1AC5B
MGRIVTIDQVGGPDVLEVREVEPPEPGIGEVRIRVQYIGVNRPDLLFRAGHYPVKPTLPGSRLGIEAAGVIESVGPEVTGFAVGDRVVAGPIVDQSSHGVYGDFAIVPAVETVLAFDDVDARLTVASWIPYLTAYSGMASSGGLKAGDHVLITAASSSVGLAAIDVANHLGAVPLASTSSEAKAGRLLAAGARHVIVGRDGLADTVRSMTGGRGADLVFDATGGRDFPATAAAASDAGTVVRYGWFDDQPAILPTRWPMKIIGHINFTTTQDPARLTQVRNLIAAGLRSGAFTPHIDKEFTGLGQVAAAHAHAASGGQFGKILVAVE